MQPKHLTHHPSHIIVVIEKGFSARGTRGFLSPKSYRQVLLLRHSLSLRLLIGFKHAIRTAVALQQEDVGGHLTPCSTDLARVDQMSNIQLKAFEGVGGRGKHVLQDDGN